MFSPLVLKMIHERQYPVLRLDDVDPFVTRAGTVALLFTDVGKPLPETDDIAIILPELERAFEGRFAVAVIEQDDQRVLQRQYRFRKWPCIVFLRDGGYLGAISGLLDWADYLDEIQKILGAEISEPPAFDFTHPAGASQAVN